jgi:glycosyltransferase involved in cell wall biosynthesis
MACGAAVCCSNTSAIPEVADGAALLFDPHNADEIARAMLDLIQLPELRTRMQRLGQQRASHFSWQKTAQETLGVYYEVVEQYQPARGTVLTAPITPR